MSIPKGNASFRRGLSSTSAILITLISGAVARAEMADRDLVNRAAWVGNAIYHQTQEDLVIGAALRDIYRSNPKTEPIEALREANQLRQEYIAQRKRLGGQSPEAGEIREVADTISALAKSIPGLERYSSVLEKAGNWGARLYDGTIGAESQIIAQVQNYQKYSELQDAPATWESIWLAANATNEGGLAINAYLAPLLNANTHQDTSQILANNPNFAANASLLKLAGPDGTVNVLRKDLESAFYQFNQQLNELNQANLASQGSMANLSIDLHQREIDREAAEQALARAEVTRGQQKLQLQGARSAVYVLSVLGGVLDPALSKPISTVGNATIQIADALSQAGTLSVSGAGSAILTGNILGAVMSVAGLFGVGTSSDHLILNQLQALSYQLAQVSECLDARFDRVDVELGQMMEYLRQNFAHFNSSLIHTQEDIGAIKKELLAQQASLNQLGSDVFLHFSKTFRTNFLRSFSACLGPDTYAAVEGMSYQTYRQCLGALAGYSTDTSAQLLQSAALSEDDTPLTYRALGSRLSKGSLDSNIDLLSRISEKVFSNPLLTSLSEADVRSPIANPVEWAIGAQAYLDLVAAHPEFTRLTELSGVDKVLEIGWRIDRVLKNISTFATIAGPQPNTKFFHLLMDTYRASTRNLMSRLAQIQADFVVDPAQAIPLGIDIFRDEKQEIPKGGVLPGWGTPERLRSCSHGTLQKTADVIVEDLYVADSLKMPVGEAEALTPIEVKNAERLSLVGTEFCYSATLKGAIARDAQVELSLVLKVNGIAISRKAVRTLPLQDLFRSVVGNAIVWREADRNPIELMNQFSRLIVDWSNWTSDSQLDSLLAKARVEIVPGGDAALVGISASVRGKLSEKREALRLRMRDVLGGPLNDAVSELSGLKALIESYVQLGLPKTWAKSDYLRMLLRGEEQVFDRDSLLAWMDDGKRSLVDARGIQAEMDRRIDALEKELIRTLTNDHPGLQTYPALSATLLRLQDMKQDRTKFVPKVPVSQVVEEINVRLAKISSGQGLSRTLTNGASDRD